MFTILPSEKCGVYFFLYAALGCPTASFEIRAFEVSPFLTVDEIGNALLIIASCSKINAGLLVSAIDFHV